MRTDRRGYYKRRIALGWVIAGFYALAIFNYLWRSFPTRRTALCLGVVFAILGGELLRRLALRFFRFLRMRECPACHQRALVVRLDLPHMSDEDPSDDWVPADCTHCQRQFRLDGGGEFHERNEDA